MSTTKTTYYAVVAGNQTGIFTNWDAVDQATKGYHNSFYKKFSTRAESDTFYNAPEVADFLTPSYTAYVDGSHNPNTDQYGSGAVILQDNMPVATISIAGSNPKYVAQGQIPGETNAAIFAMEWMLNAFKADGITGARQLNIVHDYIGIAGWPIGWEAKDDLGKAYITRYRSLITPGVAVRFHKVPAHSYVHYNEWADQLAKKAAGMATANPHVKPDPYISNLTPITSGLKPL